MKLTGSVVVKKSMSFPTVKGMLSDTVDDTRSKPIAIVKGFLSGLVSATILRSEAADDLPSPLLGAERPNDGSQDNIERRGDLAGG